MEATLAMASLGRFNPDGPHIKMAMKNYENYPIYRHFNPENIPGILLYEWFEKKGKGKPDGEIILNKNRVDFTPSLWREYFAVAG